MRPHLVGIEAARATLKDLCAAAARGEEVVITRRGRPIARVVGVDKPCPRCGVPHADAGSDVVPCPRCGERFPRAFPGQNGPDVEALLHAAQFASPDEWARIEAALVPRRHEPLAVTYARVLRERDLDEVVAYRANGSPLTRAEMADLIDAGDAEALRFLDLFAASGVRAMGVKARREQSAALDSQEPSTVMPIPRAFPGQNGPDVERHTCDRWRGQPLHVSTWPDKDTIAGVPEKPCACREGKPPPS